MRALYVQHDGHSQHGQRRSGAVFEHHGQRNTALGYRAGANATTGSDNVFVGAEVRGTAADTNLIRIGRAYDSGAGTGQNQTFVAGIYGTELSGVVQPVFVDANGQLGTVTPGAWAGGGRWVRAALQQQVRDLQQHDCERSRRPSKNCRPRSRSCGARLARVEARQAPVRADGRVHAGGRMPGAGRRARRV